MKPDNATADSNKTEPPKNDTNGTSNVTEPKPGDANATNATNMTDATNTTEKVEPEPYVPSSPCILYGIERYKDSECSQLDDQFTAEGKELASGLNNVIEYDKCQSAAGK